MRLENRKILTAKRVGIATFMVVAVYIVTANLLNKEEFGSYTLLGKLPQLISDRVIQKATLFNTTSFIAMTTSTESAKTIFTASQNATAMKTNATMTSPTTKMITTTTTTTTETTAQTKTIATRNPKTIEIFTMTRSKTSTAKYRNLQTTTVYPLTTTPTKHFICLNLMGRLGNLMFQYATAYGIARSKGMNVIISEKEHITKIFHLDRGGKLVKDTSMCRGVETRGESQASAFDKNLMNFKNNKNIALWGYLQSFKYFENVSGEIRYQFTFRDSIKSKAENILREILHRHSEKHSNETKNWTFVAVHVRRGDMVNHPHGYMVAPKEYFYRTQNMFRALYKHILFVVCSDDIRWCKDNLQNENTYFVTGNSPAVDMAVLSSCNHTITSVGSFSWWSAWLSSGIVTYYFPPARPGSGLRRAYSKDFSDYFPPNWIRVKS